MAPLKKHLNDRLMATLSSPYKRGHAGSPVGTNIGSLQHHLHSTEKTQYISADTNNSCIFYAKGKARGVNRIGVNRENRTCVYTWVGFSQ